jgi:hypothetical protein
MIPRNREQDLPISYSLGHKITTCAISAEQHPGMIIPKDHEDMDSETMTKDASLFQTINFRHVQVNLDGNFMSVSPFYWTRSHALSHVGRSNEAK